MRTIEEINEKIKKGKVVVVTAEEMTSLVKEKGVKEAYKKVDVVTTATFSPMCSSGMYLNVGHTHPRIRFGGGRCTLNKVQAYCGFAAVDVFLGASSLPEDDPRNKIYPGEFKYGGGHVIEDFVSGKDILLEVRTYPTDCYPRSSLQSFINIKDVNQATLFNIRNCYQNYNVAVNLSNKTIYTYMGILRPQLGNATFCSAGSLSPLLNDPFYKTIGVGTKIFLGGGEGFIIWYGTQHNPHVPRTSRGIPKEPAGTLAVIGDLKKMNSRYLRGVSIIGYGVSLSVGIGVPIPIIDEEMAFYTSVDDGDILMPVVDYSKDYPQGEKKVLEYVNFKDLKSGRIKLMNKSVPAGSLSSLPMAREIASVLKQWIKEGRFLLTKFVSPLPGREEGVVFKDFKERL